MPELIEGGREEKYFVGIDLHGTLLGADESVAPGLEADLARAVARAARVAEVYTCTGNDLTFVEEKLGPAVLGPMAGHILETGCVLGSGGGERLLVDADTAARVGELRAAFEARPGALAGVEYFLRRRLATVSLFCCAEHLCYPPEEFLPLVQDYLARTGWDRWFWAAHSSVAVDIIPHGFNKFEGLKRVAGAGFTVGVADSDNDRDLILRADLAFAPSNLSASLRRAVESSGRALKPLDAMRGLEHDTVGLASAPETEGVTLILKHIASALGG